MQSTELLHEGLALMAMGMGFVFVFLTVLVLSVIVMSKLVGRFQPAPAASPKAQRGARPSEANESSDEVVAVISAAVHRYRQSRDH